MSSKIKIIYILMGFLILLASIKAGLALEEGFGAYSDKEAIYTCSCALTQNDLFVDNSGDITSSYTIRQSGSALGFSSLAESAFSLESGKSRKIADFIRIPCGITGEYELKTEFETLFGLKKEFTQLVNVGDCVNINAALLAASPPVCPCSPGKFIFRIENTGTFLETYKLSIGSTYADISKDILVLKPQQSANVTVFITTPCGQYGDLSFDLNIYSENSGMTADLPFMLYVAPCYNYTMSGLSQYSVCEGLSNAIPVTIKNTADVANTYFFDADAEWASFDNYSLNLWGGQEGKVNLIVYPVDVGPANYNIAIGAVTARGEIRKEMNVAVDVGNCYSLNMTSSTGYLQIVNGEKGSFPITVNNDGTRQSNYSLILTGPEWVSIEQKEVSVPSGKSKEVKINYDTPLNISGGYQLNLLGSIASQPEKAWSLGVSFDVVSIEDAYRLEIDADPRELETNYDGKTIDLMMNNVGIREGRYTLVVSGTNFTKIDDGKVTIPAQGGKSVGLTLNPKNQNITPEGTYSVTIDAILEGNNLAYSRTFDIKVREKTLWEKAKGLFSSYWIYMLLSFGTLIALLALILGIRSYKKRHPKEEKVEEIKEEAFIEKEKPGWLRRILVILLLLMLLGAIGSAAYYFGYLPYFGNMTNATNMTKIEKPKAEPPKPVETKPEPVTNATIFVNRTGLRGYGNVIEIIGLENITIPLVIQNSDEPNTYIIKIKEDIDWIKTDKSTVNIPPKGRQTVYIFVTPTPDVKKGNYNLSVAINIAGRENPISEEIVLSVREKEPFYKTYMWYLIGGILALLLILAAIKIKESKEKEEYEELDGIKKAEEPEGHSKLKGFLVVLILILLAILLIGALVYVGMKVIHPIFTGANATMNQTPKIEPKAELNKTEEIPEENYEHVFVKKGTETYIPIKISNVNKTTTFRIKVREDVDWLYVDNEMVDVAPEENKTIYLIASPNATVESGNYKVSVDINIAQGEKVLSKYFILSIKKSRFSGLFSYLYYIMAGFLVLYILTRIMGRDSKEEYKEESYEEKEEKPRKKTSLKLK